MAKRVVVAKQQNTWLLQGIGEMRRPTVHPDKQARARMTAAVCIRLVLPIKSIVKSFAAA